MSRGSSDIYSPTASSINDFDGQEGDGVGSLWTAMEEDSLGDTYSDEYVTVAGKNGRVKRTNRGKGEVMEAKQSKGGQKGKIGKGVAMLMR